MFSKSKIFIGVLICFMLGIVLANYFGIKEIFISLLILTFFILLVIGVIAKNKKIIIIFLFLLSILLGFVYFNKYVSKINYNLPYNQNVEFEALVCDYPDIRSNNIKLKVSVTQPINSNIPNGSKILINLPKYPQYQYGDILKIKGLLEQPGSWDGFEYDKYLYKSEIFALIKNSYDTKIEKIAEGQGNIVLNYIFKLKDRLIVNIDSSLNEPYAGLLNALLLGNKRKLSEDLLSLFVMVGISHIIVVSGYHVAVVSLIFEKIAIYWPRILSFVIGNLILLAFVILAGAQASVTRAVVMAWLFILALFIGRSSRIFNALILTCFIMILIKPIILVYDIGFQLSIASILGILYIAPILEKKLNIKNYSLKVIIATTFGAQLMTAPLVVYYFGRISLIAPLANILILPIIPLVMSLGIILLITTSILSKISFIIAWPIYFLEKYIVWIVEMLSKIRFASLNIVFDKFYYVIIVYLIIFLFIRLAKKHEIKIL